MSGEVFVKGRCCGKDVKVISVFMGDTYIEWPDGTREWVGRETKVEWPIE